jgi:phage replication O-like protein O
MADVQIENGYTRIAHEILEEVSKRKFNATQLSVLMIVWRMTYGFKRKDHELSVNFFVQATGFSKRNIQEAVSSLIEARVLIETKQASFNQTRKIAFNKNYDEWLIASRTKDKQVKKSSPHEEKLASTGEEKFTSPDEESFTQERNNKEIYKKNSSSNDVSEIISFWDQNGFGYNNINAKDELLSYLDDGMPAELILEALKIACNKNARHIKFVKGVFRNWNEAGVKTIEQARELENRKTHKKKSIFAQGDESKKRQQQKVVLTAEQKAALENWEEELPF